MVRMTRSPDWLIGSGRVDLMLTLSVWMVERLVRCAKVYREQGKELGEWARSGSTPVRRWAHLYCLRRVSRVTGAPVEAAVGQVIGFADNQRRENSWSKREM